MMSGTLYVFVTPLGEITFHEPPDGVAIVYGHPDAADRFRHGVLKTGAVSAGPVEIQGCWLAAQGDPARLRGAVEINAQRSDDGRLFLPGFPLQITREALEDVSIASLGRLGLELKAGSLAITSSILISFRERVLAGLLCDVSNGLFDCAAAWDAIEPALQRKLGAAVIAERLAWQGYAKDSSREGLRLIAMCAGTFIQNVVRDQMATFVASSLPPDLRGFLPTTRQCVRCGAPHPYEAAPAALPDELICSPCWSKAARASEAARVAALRGRKL